MRPDVRSWITTIADWATPLRLRWTLVALAAIVVTTLISGHPGLRVQDVTLDDGGVWVTHPSEHALARFNTGIRELTGELDTGVETFEVVQDADAVLLVETTRLTTVDVTTVTRTTSVTLPAGAEVDLAADMVMIWDAAAGETWLRPVETLGSFDALRDSPDAEPGPGGVSVLRRDGSVATLTAAGQEFHTVWAAPSEGSAAGADAAQTTRPAGAMRPPWEAGSRSAQRVGPSWPSPGPPSPCRRSPWRCHRTPSCSSRPRTAATWPSPPPTRC